MKNLMISTLVLASLFVGCKSSGGICCDADGVEQPYTELLLDPVAVLDNRTDENLYFFNCENSYDRDENNQSIVRCDWNITTYMDGHSSSSELSGTEVNVSNYQGMPGSILVKLTVIDDDNQTDETNITVPLLF